MRQTEKEADDKSASLKLCFILVIQHAVAKTFKIRILDLLAELFAHAFGVLALFAHTRAISAARRKSLFYGFYNFLVGI